MEINQFESFIFLDTVHALESVHQKPGEHSARLYLVWFYAYYMSVDFSKSCPNAVTPS